MGSNSILLEAQEIGRRPPDGQRWLLDGISLALAAADRLSVVGPSGSGKTLLLRALAVLDPLQRGRILWRGEPIPRDRVTAFRRQVMYLHQRSALLEDTVEAALRQPFGLAVHRGRRFDRQRIVGLLAELGRDERFLEGRTGDLSGGEMQIVALVRALQLDPTVLLLDEPTSALDDRAAAAVERLIARWIDDEAPAGRALVWVTHDALQARRVSRTMLNLDGGRMVRG